MQLPIALAAAVIAIQDVSVIDVIKGKAMPEKTVIVKDNKVADIVGRAPRNASLVVDGKGKFLIPGLWDMHIHIRGGVESIPDNETFLKLYVANGVTYVREMGGDIPETVFAWRKEIEEGKRLGPRIFTSGPKLDGPKPSWPGSIPVSNAEEGRQAVRKLHLMGADLVKVYFDYVEPAVLRAIADEAEKWKMPVAGHFARNLTIREQVEAGIRDGQHARFYLLQGSCTDERYIAREFVKRRNSDKPMGFDEWTRKLLEEFNLAQERSLMSMLVDSKAWFTPTLAVGAAGLTVGMRSYSEDPRAKYIPAHIWKSWDPSTGLRKAPTDEVRSLRALVQRKGLEFIPKLRDAGVPLLAGTDTGFANSYVFPGWSLHEEISLMREAGLTNFEALQTATIHPARYFKLEKTHGTIARDKAADLVLIDGNPLVDIRNTAKISGVMVNGKWFGKADLDRLLAEAAQEAATSRK